MPDETDTDKLFFAISEALLVYHANTAGAADAERAYDAALAVLLRHVAGAVACTNGRITSGKVRKILDAAITKIRETASFAMMQRIVSEAEGNPTGGSA